MPLVRYVLFTSGILLALLFWTDWYFPKSADAGASTDVDRTVIRIHSGRRWPTAVSFDTSAPMPRATPEAMAAAEIPAPAPAPMRPLRQAYAYDPPPAAKALEQPRHRARPVSRQSSRQTQRRLASTQFNPFPATW
jgi:hypothetical protein